jgi:hypothetical protein
MTYLTVVGWSNWVTFCMRRLTKSHVAGNAKAKVFDPFCASILGYGSLRSSVSKDAYTLRLLHKGIESDWILDLRRWYLTYVLYPTYWPVQRIGPVHLSLAQTRLDVFKKSLIQTFPDLQSHRCTWTLYPPKLFFVNTRIMLQMVYALYLRANPAALTHSCFKLVFRCTLHYARSPIKGSGLQVFGPYVIDRENSDERESTFLTLIERAINDYVLFIQV